jgi:Tol biopolymer transport system component
MEKEVKPADLEALKAVGTKAGGLITWTSSRAEGVPHIFTMKTDGSDTKQLTKGDNTDWRPRFSPDGSKILFQRSREGDFVRESAANDGDTWDLYTIGVDGTDLKKVAEDATWGSWASPDEIVFMRGSRIMRAKLGAGVETKIIDTARHAQFADAIVQAPELSHDGHFLALTLAGGHRQVGIYNIKKKVWTDLAQGKQIDWAPDGASVYWVDAAGKEGFRIAREPVVAGLPADERDPDKILLVDLGGKRSREAFPRLSNDGKWLVFASAVGDLENDFEDYELFLWEAGSPSTSATRLTFHTANDRWPDVFIGEAGKAAPAEEAKGEGAKSEGAKGEDSEGQPPAQEPEPKKAAPAEEKEAAPPAASEEAPDEGAAPAAPAKAKGKKKKHR